MFDVAYKLQYKGESKAQSYGANCFFKFSDFNRFTREYQFAFICGFNNYKMIIIEFYFDKDFIINYSDDVMEALSWIGEEVKGKNDIKDVRLGAIKEILERIFEEEQYKLKV